MAISFLFFLKISDMRLQTSDIAILITFGDKNLNLQPFNLSGPTDSKFESHNSKLIIYNSKTFRLSHPVT